MADQLRILSVHAHPDDEASKGAGTIARYVHEGARAVLVCCTGGEAGDILNPAMDRPEVRDRLARGARGGAGRLGGGDRLRRGRDARLPGLGHARHARERRSASPSPSADLDEAIGRLVEVIRRERPQVILTYGDDQEGYPHPDHLRVHDISVPAFERAGDPDAYPEHGRAVAAAEAVLLGLVAGPHRRHAREVPRARSQVAVRGSLVRAAVQDDRLTTHIDVGDYYDVRVKALRAHATQIDPTSPFWFGLPDEVAATVYPWEEYILAQSRVPTEIPEDDLFAGIRDRVDA